MKKNKATIFYLILLIIIIIFVKSRFQNNNINNISDSVPIINENINNSSQKESKDIKEYTNYKYYYVSIDGNDSNEGSLDYPLKTIEAAFKAISNSGLTSSDLAYIYIKSGDYSIEKTISLDNCNPNNVNVVIEPYNDSNVIFTGGLSIESKNLSSLSNAEVVNKLSSKDVVDKIKVYDLSNTYLNFDIYTDSIITAPQLFINDSSMTLSRYPNINSYVYTGNPINNSSFKYYDYNINNFSSTDNIFISGYLGVDWYNQIYRLSNYSNITLSLSSNSKYDIQKNMRFYFFNVLSELDSSNEYYIDYDNKLLYFIPPDDISEYSIELSLLNEPILTMNNCSNITIKGIQFKCTRDSALTIYNCNNIRIQDCIVKNISNDGIVIKEGYNNLIDNCNIFNIGSNGIFIEGGDRNSLTRCNHVVSNNIIHDFSQLTRTYNPGIGANGVGITISNNSLYNAPHSAIIFSGNDNVIEYNDISNVATETNDVGAIYTGRDWTFRGNVIRYNNLHDIGSNSDFDFVIGIYLDDCMSSAEIYGNTLSNIKVAMNIGGGRDNIIVDNTISNCTNSILFDDRGLTWSDLTELKSKLNNVPYKSNTWINHYPELSSLINTDNPGIPYGNTIANNVLINTSPMVIADTVRKYGNIN